MKLLPICDSVSPAAPPINPDVAGPGDEGLASHDPEDNLVELHQGRMSAAGVRSRHRTGSLDHLAGTASLFAVPELTRSADIKLNRQA